MTDKIKNNLTSLVGGNKDTLDQLLLILNLPDDVFDSAFDEIKDSIAKAYDNAAVQKEVLNIIATNPEFDIEEEKRNIDSIIEEIKEEEDLSDKKKELLGLIIKESTSTLFDLALNPRERIGVKIQLINPDAQIPKYAHDSDAGADIFAVEEVSLPPHTTKVIPTGIKIAIPAGYEIQIRPRSGLSLKTPLRVANAPGTIDANYRGEVGVIIENTGNLTQVIKKGDKIAQMLIAPTPMIRWEQVETLDETDRGEGGFGSTDKS